MRPRFGEAGEVTGIFTQGYDVTDTHLASEASFRSEEQQAFRISLDEKLRDLGDPREIMAVAAKFLGEKLGASRCGFAEIDEAMDDVTVLRDWTDGVHSTAVGHFCMNDFGQAFIDGLRAGHAVRLDDAPGHGRLRPAAAARFRLRL